ncbi:hypothetical protein JCM24511_07149 [Saitozyma sp. JCM 24511]|nr:hypothetical protein JCM24511_07149 [Saitozyma sp. JCM 24511]
MNEMTKMGYLSIQRGSSLADDLDILRIMRDNAETTSTSSEGNSEQIGRPQQLGTGPSRLQPGFTTTGYLRPLVFGALSSTLMGVTLSTPALEVTAPKSIDEHSRAASVTGVPTMSLQLDSSEIAKAIAAPDEVQLRIPVEAIESLLAEAEAQRAHDQRNDSEASDGSTSRIFGRSEMMKTSDRAMFGEGTDFTLAYPTNFGELPVELWIGDEMMPVDPGQVPKLTLVEVLQASPACTSTMSCRGILSGGNVRIQLACMDNILSGVRITQPDGLLDPTYHAVLVPLRPLRPYMFDVVMHVVSCRACRSRFVASLAPH